MSNKIICCMICENEQDWIALSLKSVLTFVDKVLIIDGGSTDNTLKIIDSFCDERIDVRHVRFKHEQLGSDGAQRNSYLDIVKKEYMNDWIIVVDADEILSDDAHKLRDLIKTWEENKVYCVSPRMEHFMWNFGLVDAVKEKHFVPNRIFKVTENLMYKEQEHSILEGYEGIANVSNDIIFYHCGYLKGVIPTIEKYHKHIKKSGMHSKEFLDSWRICHLQGSYITKPYSGPYPKPLAEYFLLKWQ